MSPTQHLQKPIYTNLSTQHPPFGLPYERIVPPTDATILDQFLPAGTIIGMSPWATHRDASTFGPDASAWRPERWLEGSSHTRRQMENALLTFGAGNRSCIGKHISYLEISKLVPSLVRRYKVRNDLHFPPFPFPFHKSRRSGGGKTKTTRVQTPPPPDFNVSHKSSSDAPNRLTSPPKIQSRSPSPTPTATAATGRSRTAGSPNKQA